MSRYGQRTPLEERFWRYVSPEPNTGCWLWDGGLCKGYGVIGNGGGDGKQRLATHVALEIHGHPRPFAKAQACHHCDIPACVDPQHLYWGTASQNRYDAMHRGRLTQARGESHVNSLLTDEAVRYIRASDKSGDRLSVEFGVSHQLISEVRRGKRWRHVVVEN